MTPWENINIFIIHHGINTLPNPNSQCIRTTGHDLHALSYQYIFLSKTVVLWTDTKTVLVWSWQLYWGWIYAILIVYLFWLTGGWRYRWLVRAPRLHSSSLPLHPCSMFLPVFRSEWRHVYTVLYSLWFYQIMDSRDVDYAVQYWVQMFSGNFDTAWLLWTLL